MVDLDIPLRVDVWEKAASGWSWATDIDPNQPANPLTAFAMDPRWNSPGPWSMTVPWHELGWIDENHLLTCDFRGTRETLAPERLRDYLDDKRQPAFDVSGTTALSILADGGGWPSPTKAIGDQDSVRYYTEGPAETVLLDFIRANFVTRLGYDMVVAPSKGRGPTITVNSEFSNVLAVVTSKAILAGLTLRVGLVNRPGTRTRADLTVWFEEPVDRTADSIFSPEAGSLRAYASERSIPSATRAIIQAAKEKQGREVNSVNVSANSITTKGNANKLRTGDIVTFTGGTPPAPLEVGVDYHAVKVDANTFKVAMTRADAAQGLVVDLTDEGAGKITATESTRRYRTVSNSDAEAGWWRVRETLVEGNGEDRNPALDEQGRVALNEAKAQSAFELETTETPGMRYADPISLGDIVRVNLPVGPERSERVGGAKVSIGGGLVVQIVLGNPDGTDPEMQMAAEVRRIKSRSSRARED